MSHLGKALDQVRKSEYARLSGKDRHYIKGQKYTLLLRRTARPGMPAAQDTHLHAPSHLITPKSPTHFLQKTSESKCAVCERVRDDFTTLLRNCAVSVSQAGYNTTLEILDAGARAVLVPFAGGAETEQALHGEFPVAVFC